MSEIRGRELRSRFYQNLSSVYVPGQICLYQVLFAAVDKNKILQKKLTLGPRYDENFEKVMFERLGLEIDADFCMSK